MDAIRKAGGDDLSDDDIDKLVTEVRRRREQRAFEFPMESESAALEAVGQQMAGQERLAALIEKRSRAINVLRKQQRMNFYAGFEGKEAQGLSIINVGSEKTGAGYGRSVAAEQRALEAKLIGPMLGELRQNGLDSLLAKRTPEFEREVARDMWAATDGKPLTGSPQAQAIAKILVKYQEAARLMQNDAGAWIGKMPGYVVRQSHDMFRIRRAGYDAWRESIGQKLDERTFDGVENREKYLRNVYNALATGEHYKERGADDWLGGFKGPGSVAKRASQERSLHFKSADDWFAYNQEFGLSSLLEAAAFGLRKAAHNTALMRTWGTNPEAAFLADLQQLSRQAADRADTKQVEKLKGWLIRSEFDQVNGTAKIPGNPTWAAVGSAARAIISMAKLGGAVLSSIPDIGTKAATLRHHGIGFLEGYGNALNDVVRGRGKGVEREIADSIGVGTDGLLGAIMSRFSATDNVPGRIAKLQNQFFKANLLSWWTDGKATGAGLVMSHNLARNTGKAFADLDPMLQASLRRYGIQSDQWEALRKVDLKVDGDTPYLTPDAVLHLPDEAIAHLATGKGEKALQRAREDLEIGLRSFYIDQVDSAITQGGARERAIATWGTKPGTPVGEAVRSVMQFKLYPITFATRQLGREISRGDVLGAVHLMVATTALGFLSLQAKELAKGRSPRDPTDPKTWAAAMQQGGGLGIYGDFLFGEYNRFGGGALETLAGPTVGTVSQVLRAFSEVKEGDAKGAASELFRATTGAIPFINLFYTRAAFDYLFLYQVQEMMNPGYLRRFERRIEKENSQTFLIRPSEIVPRGGGIDVASVPGFGGTTLP